MGSKKRKARERMAEVRALGASVVMQDECSYVDPDVQGALMKMIEKRHGLPRAVEQEVVLDALRRAWQRHPELRLGQLISNALPVLAAPDPYYIEDTTLTERLEAY